MMNIRFNGGLLGREALCFQGRGIVKELSKFAKVKIEGNPTSGYWEKFYTTFKDDVVEDFYVMNGHPTYLPKLAINHKNIISIVVFETNLPPEWVKSINIPEVKQVWTISEFCKRKILESGVKKDVKVIYLGIDERFKYKNVNIFAEDKTFKFINVCAPHGVDKIDRKGLHILIEAFKEEFGDNDDVLLLLKINTIYADQLNRNLGKSFDIRKYVSQFIPSKMEANNISVITDYFKPEGLNSLYNSIDCGVFPSMGEGLGLPQAELIKIGKPVITTNHSATNEFSDKMLRIKVDRLDSLPYNCFPYYQNTFAYPNKDDLRRLMREVYMDRLKFQKRAKNQSHKVKELNWDLVGKKLKRHLSELK